VAARRDHANPDESKCATGGPAIGPWTTKVETKPSSFCDSGTRGAAPSAGGPSHPLRELAVGRNPREASAASLVTPGITAWTWWSGPVEGPAPGGARPGSDGSHACAPWGQSHGRRTAARSEDAQ
jgi:hypothetical protein